MSYCLSLLPPIEASSQTGAEETDFLYHTTTIKNFIQILDTGILSVSKQTGRFSAVSVSRDRNYVRYGLTEERGFVRMKFILAKLLENGYSIKRYQETAGFDGQREEHITPSVRDIIGQLAGVEYFPPDNVETLSEVEKDFVEIMEEDIIPQFVCCRLYSDMML